MYPAADVVQKPAPSLEYLPLAQVVHVDPSPDSPAAQLVHVESVVLVHADEMYWPAEHVAHGVHPAAPEPLKPLPQLEHNVAPPVE